MYIYDRNATRFARSSFLYLHHRTASINRQLNISFNVKMHYRFNHHTRFTDSDSPCFYTRNYYSYLQSAALVTATESDHKNFAHVYFYFLNAKLCCCRYQWRNYRRWRYA